MNSNINDTYWMKIVEDVSHASTCRKQLGCVLVKDKYCIGMGYVGSVHGDIHCKTSDWLDGCLLVENDNKYGSGDSTSCIRTIHAEMNAILNMHQNTHGTEDSWITCYSTYQPCLNCLKALLQIGVRVFIYQYPYLDVNRDLYIDNFPMEILSTFTMYKI